jgi:hypothetical protein
MSAEDTLQRSHSGSDGRHLSVRGLRASERLIAVAVIALFYLVVGLVLFVARQTGASDSAGDSFRPREFPAERAFEIDDSDTECTRRSFCDQGR